MTNRNRTVYGLRSKDHGLVYEGYHLSFTDAVHDALKNNIDLNGIDMTGQNLRNLNLDGINLSNADFSNSDLTGANMSEALFTNCVFSNSTLFDASFCYSDIVKSTFIETRFGVTDLSEAKISNSEFSGPSTFNIDFARAYLMKENIYRHEHQKLKMGKPPKIFSGYKNSYVFLDDKVIAGNEVYDFSSHELNNIISIFLMDLLKANSISG